MKQLKPEMQVTAPALKLQRWQQRIKDNPLDLYVANRRVVHTRNWLIRVCISGHKCLNKLTNLIISPIRLSMQNRHACSVLAELGSPAGWSVSAFNQPASLFIHEVFE